MGPGDFFGEYSCISAEPRSATVVAIEFCELHTLSRSDIEAVVNRMPDMAPELRLLLQQKNSESQPNIRV